MMLLMLSSNIMSTTTATRTTVTLDQDVLERLKEESRQRGDSFRNTLNDLLRLALSVQKNPLPERKFKVRPFDNTGPIPGLNFDKIGDLLDYIEGEDRKW
jgi:hypothetical protein